MPYNSQTADDRHLLIRVRCVDAADTIPGANALPQRLTVEVEAQVDHSSIYPAGRVDLNLLQLRKLEQAPGNEYGRVLAQCLAASLPLQTALGAVAQSSDIRIQLMLEPAGYPLSLVRWERLQFANLSGSNAISTADRTPFSRFGSVNREQVYAPADLQFDLLAIVASPKDVVGLAPISPDEEVNALLQACGPLLERSFMKLCVLPGRSGLSPKVLEECQRLNVVVEPGSCSLQRVSDLLTHRDKGFAALQVIAHGSFHSNAFHIFLEDEDGQLYPASSEEILRQWQPAKLRLIYLQSCHSAAEGTAPENDPRPHVSGFMQELIEAGVPGVVAMQDSIRMDDARAFCRSFYTSLLSDGCADRAVNAGRASIPDDGTARWSIPAFATRLGDAAVWKRSPLRTAQERLYRKISDIWKVRRFRPLPIEGRLQTRAALKKIFPGDGDEFSTMTDDGGLQMDAYSVLRGAVTADAPPFTAIIGPRGRAKAQLLEWLFLQSFGPEVKPSPHDPVRHCVMLRLSDCAHPAYDAETTLARAVAAYYEELTGITLDAQALAERFSKEAFAFLIRGDDNVGQTVREALRLFETYSKKALRHRFILSLEENLLHASHLPEDSQCLQVRQMRPERVRAFLGSADATADERELLRMLEDYALFDLAEVPWLLNEMVELVRQRKLKPSRAKIIGRIIDDGVLRYKGSAASAVRLRETLQRFAWEALTRRDYYLPGSEAFEILQKLRGNRDYPLSAFLADMISSCKILAYMDDDGVGFNYPGFRSYCAAEYLLNQNEDERNFLLEEITAQLGRQSRAELWRDTLYILAGLWNKTDDLLSMILSGSLLYQGEQLFIAARCLQEARLSFDNQPASDNPIVQSIVGSLLQQTSPVGLRSVRARVRALQHIGPLRESCALEALIRLVLEKVRPGRKGDMHYDYSAVRLGAMKALLYMARETLTLVKENPKWKTTPDLATALHAWISGDGATLSRMLRAPEPVCSIAAFALALSRQDNAFEALTEAFRREDTSLDMQWAVADSLIELADPELPQYLQERITQAPDAHSEMLAHMLGKLGQASQGSKEWNFLEQRVAGRDGRLAGRCLQALAELSSTSVIPICHQWLQEQAEHLPYFALQALREVGRWESLKLIERLRWDTSRMDTSRMLFLDSVRMEVYEAIYWRLAGGLSRETMARIGPDETQKTMSKGGGA